jgi:hypothetical protein
VRAVVPFGPHRMVTSSRPDTSTPVRVAPAEGDTRPLWRTLPVLALLAGALVLRLILWNRAIGFEQGDPLEYVNIAYKLAFGIGIEWWDLRPLLLPLLYVPVLYVAQWWPDPTGEAMVRALRLVSVAFGVGTVWLTYRLGRQLAGELVGLGAGLLVAVNPVVNRMSVSTYAELPSTFFVLLCLWLLVLAVNAAPARDRWLALGAGLALGVGCMIRYQAIFYLPPVGLWVGLVALARTSGSLAHRVRALLSSRTPAGALLHGFAGGLLLAVLAQAIIEQLAYGQPFHSLLASFSYNVTSGLAPVEFGAEPFDWFVRELPGWFGLAAAALMLVGLTALRPGTGSSGAAGWRLVVLTGATMFLALSALPHKETRFMSQVVPLLALLAAQGAATLGGLVRRAPPAVGVAVAGGLLLVAAVPMLAASWSLDLQFNVGYVTGVKRAAELKPGGTLGTVPWLVARPYAGTRLTLERMDRNVWNRRDEVTRTIETSDFLLFPEFWLLEDLEIDRLVEARFRSIDGYDDGVVLYERRAPEEPSRRRSR